MDLSALRSLVRPPGLVLDVHVHPHICFGPYRVKSAAAVARVVNDLSDAGAAAILSENARRLLKLPAKIRKTPN